MPASRPQNNTDSTLEDRNTYQRQPTHPIGAYQPTTATSTTDNHARSALSHEQSSKKHEPVDPKHQHQQQRNGSLRSNNSRLDQQRNDQHHHAQSPHHSSTTTTATAATRYTTAAAAEEEGAEEDRGGKRHMSSASPNITHAHHPPAHASAAAAAMAGAASMPAEGEGASPRASIDSRRSSVASARSVAQPSQSPRNLTPSPTIMPQRHLGLLLRPGPGQGFGAMVGQALASGARSIVGSMVGTNMERGQGSGGGSIASGHGTPASVAPSAFSNQHHTGNMTAAGRSPILTNEDSAEQTLLLVRPTWIQDQAVNECAICSRNFNAVRRKHHCRQCGRVVCHDCSSRSLVLPQLGYTKAVRVCDGCFDVAYLVAYILSDDLGPTTQIHGARGLYDIVEGENEGAIQSVLDHGGLDAIVFLCRLNHSYELHALATSFLATLTDKGPHLHPLIVNKRAMPNLYHLVTFYCLVQQQQHLHRRSSPSNGSPTRSPPSVTAYTINPKPMPLTRMGSLESVQTRTTKRIETITLIMMNVTHIIFGMVSNNKELSRQLARNGGLDSLMTLSVYFPAGVRTRAMEEALKSMNEHSQTQQSSRPLRPPSVMSTLSVSDHELQSEQSSTSGRSGSLDLAEMPSGASAVDEDDEENALIHMDEWFHQRLEGMQQLAAKSISIMASDAVNQAYMVDDPERVDRVVQLLYSTNPDVVKYAAKTTAFLSLRNDKHKTNFVRGAGVPALLMVILLAREQQFSEATESEDQTPTADAGSRRSSSSPSFGSGTMGGPKLSAEAVSHACCTLANLATSIESQDVLMSHSDLIEASCGVVGLFPGQTEVERHVSRLIANLALYDQNKLCLLTDRGAVHGQPVVKPTPTHAYRYSSPPPPPHRTRGNVVPTLMTIGAMTLELPTYAAAAAGFQDPLDPYHVHHPAVVPPSMEELVASLQEELVIPELVAKESAEDFGQQPSSYHQHCSHQYASNSFGTSPAAERYGLSLSTSPLHSSMVSGGPGDLSTATIPMEAWRTVAGTEDIQRHFIRAIDNLLTVTTTMGGPEACDSMTAQTFKVFQKLWPTVGMILAIRASTRDEDTRRRATHVLRTLKQQQACHQPFIEQFVKEYQEEQQQQQEREEMVVEEAEAEEEEEEEDKKKRKKQKKKEEEEERLADEKAEKERLEQARQEQEEKEKERKRQEEEEVEEEKRRQKEAEEQARLEKEEEEEKKKKKDEEEKQEQERLRKKDKEEKKRLEREAKAKAEEEARLQKEKEEAERRRRQQQQQQEEEEKVEQARKQQEKEEEERQAEQARKQQEEEEERQAEQARKQQEKEEAERALKQKEEREAEEEEARRNEKQKKEEAEEKQDHEGDEDEEEKARIEKRDKIRKNVEKLRKKLEEERLQEQQEKHEAEPTEKKKKKKKNK